jgi:hypothetical protein
MELAFTGTVTSMTGEARESASSGGEERSVYIPVGFEENLSLLTTSVFYISDLLHKLETRYNTTDFTS